MYDRNLFLFCFGMFFSVQQNFCFNRKFTPEIEQKQKECVDPVLFILLQICSYNCSGKLGQIGSFCCYFCSSKLRHLSVNRISVSVNFAETSYGRTLLMNSVRLFNVGLHFLAAKVAFSCPSVDRFGKNFWGLMTLGQVKSVPNFC